ncbi:MAG: hypothetical protein GXP14_11290 [Gammaproteobacteria bacterium]|nr:hypothetical protein [Gammaproteobacteria bacterium]
MQLKLEEHDVSITNVNLRRELAMNGDEAFEKILYSENGNSEFEKHVVVINNSLDENHAKEFDDAKLCKFKATPKNGHIIDLSFQIQLHPSDDQVH